MYPNDSQLVAVRDRNGLLIRRICRELADHLEESRLVQRVGGHRLRYLRADIVWREADRIMPQIEHARTQATDKLIRASLRALDKRKVTLGPLKERRDGLVRHIGADDLYVMRQLIQALALDPVLRERLQKFWTRRAEDKTISS